MNRANKMHLHLKPTFLKVESDISERDVHRTRQLDAYEDFSSLKASDLKLRIDEMLRIKVIIKLLKYSAFFTCKL